KFLVVMRAFRVDGQAVGQCVGHFISRRKRSAVHNRFLAGDPIPEPFRPYLRCEHEGPNASGWAERAQLPFSRENIMNKTRLAVLAAVLCAGAATPAFADWDSIGSVNVSHGRDRDVRNFDLGGPVDRLQLRVENNGVECRSVNATFGNGTTRQIFSGRLYENRPTTIDLPGNNRNIKRLAFNCSAGKWRDATIRIAADIGSHREEWQHNPDFGRVWARMFNWGSDAVNNWQYVGQESFEGRRDSENVFTGWRGRSINA